MAAIRPTPDMVRPELITRWNTPDGLRRRERLLALQLRGPWREVLAGFAGSAELGDNPGDLRGIDLSQEELSGADLVRARLDGARLEDCGLVEARLDFATLSGASLAWARLDRASLVACVALDACWDDASLEGAVLTAANLARGSFRRAQLQAARLTAATLMRADLRVADLRGADLHCCDLEGARVACVRGDRPRMYGAPRAARDGRESGFPSFLDALHLPPGVNHLRFLIQGETLLHVEAALEASPAPADEIRALLRRELPHYHLVAAAALVLGGASEDTLAAVWELLDGWTAAHPQLTVAALLTDPDFEAKARVRLEDGRRIQAEVRACLEWALDLLRREPLPDGPGPEWFRGSGSVWQRYLSGLRRHVDPRLQALWLPVPRPPARPA